MKNKTKQMQKERHISLSEAAKIYGCTQKHLNLMSRRGKLKAVKVGRNWMTTLKWLKEYTDSLTEREKKLAKFGPFFKKFLTPLIIGILLFSFLTSVYVSFRDGALQIPEPIKNFVLKISSTNTQDVNKLPTQAITETNKILASTFNLNDVFQNIKQSKPGIIVIDTAKTIILGVKVVDRKSNDFFNPVFNGILAFFDKIFCGSGNFAINIAYDIIKSISRIPFSVNRFFVSLPLSIKNAFSHFGSFFSLKSFAPFYFLSPDISDQSVISIRDLYHKLKDMRELVEGKAVVIIKPIQKEIVVTKDKGLLDAELASFRSSLLLQIATDLSGLEAKIGSKMLVENNYYYSEAAKTAGLYVSNNEVDFNENIDMMKNLSVLGTITGGEISVSDDLTVASNLDVGGDLTVTGNIIGGAISYSTASVSDDFQVGTDTFYVNVGSGSYQFGDTGTASFAGPVNIANDLDVDNKTLFVDSSNNTVGVGIAPNQYNKLYVKTDAVDTDNLTGIFDDFDINPNIANGYFWGIDDNIQVAAESTNNIELLEGNEEYLVNYGSGNINYFQGQISWVDHEGSGTVTSLAGFNSNNYGNGGGDITRAYNYYAYTYYDGNENITNNSGLYIDQSSLLYTSSNIQTNYGAYIGKPIKDATSTIGTNYGIYLGDQAVGSTSYAVYSNGGQSYFAGNFGIGDTSPGYKLSVDGTTSISDDFYVGDDKLFVDVSTGLVGINTIAPGAILDVQDDDSSDYLFTCKQRVNRRFIFHSK